MTKEYRYIGKATPRKDAREIVTGKAPYIDDIQLRGMLYGKVLRSPYPHANIKSIDTSKAEVYPGVKAILTYKNVPNWKIGAPPFKHILNSKVHFVGDAVAVVAAESEGIADEALELIDVEYEPLQAVYDVEEAMKPDSPQLHAEFPGNILPRGFTFLFGPKILEEVVMGDVEKGFREADFIAEGTYAYENIPNPLPPEPPGVIATWESPEQLTVWVASQSAVQNKYFGQLAMNIPDIRAIGTYCGGSYGTKQRPYLLIGYAAALSKATGSPVRVSYTKEEHFNAFTLRIGSRVHGKVGIKKDGTVTAVSGEWLVNTGAYSTTTQGMVAVGCGEAQIILRCPNWNLQPKIICTNRNPSATVRGFGGQELASALIPLVTMAMEKADLDPFEFFKKNFVKPGDGYYWRDGNWWVYRGVDYSEAMQKGAEAFRWKDKWKGWGKPTAVDGTKRRGVGVGVQGNADVGQDSSEAYVELTSDGRALLHVNVSEAGTGERSSLCKMVAEVLNLPIDMVNITPPDTLVNPFEWGSAGSRGTYAVGSAAIGAAEEAKHRLFELAAPILGVKTEDLETKDGQIYVRGNTQKAIPWRRALGKSRMCTGRGRFRSDFSLTDCVMIFVEVEVDIETGKTELIQVIAATDCGQIIDPLAIEGQIHGALGSAGIDSALLEESVLDQTTGRILNCNMIDYKWRTFLDLPEFKNVILETPIPTHRFKAIGVGEIATAPGINAVLMAVYNAIGKRIMDYPVTPDKVLQALDKTNRGKLR